MILLLDDPGGLGGAIARYIITEGVWGGVDLQREILSTTACLVDAAMLLPISSTAVMSEIGEGAR